MKGSFFIKNTSMLSAYLFLPVASVKGIVHRAAMEIGTGGIAQGADPVVYFLQRRAATLVADLFRPVVKACTDFLIIMHTVAGIV